MRIVSRRTLREFWENYPDAEEPLQSWYREVEKANWDTPTDVKKKYGNASVIGNNRIVFNIKGITYRLVVRINYHARIVYVRFIGSHAEYDTIDVKEV
ncbi:MAG: type II toxin-antitoxin system HigB family toxin [Gammaproteobacteria bacterium]|nr:type II toxin-antitoxin system HigB family toxin [Gammaproteobacteria bacterium]